MSDTIFSRLAENLSTGRYRMLLLELLIVVLGVVIGFQVDRWYEGVRGQQQAQEYLQRLLANVQSDLDRIATAERLGRLRLRDTDRLVASLTDDSVVTEDPTLYVVSVEQAIYRFSLVANDATYQELLNTGDMALFPAATRDAMYAYYGRISEQEQFRVTYEALQEESMKRLASILTPELIAIGLLDLDCCLSDRPYTETEALATAERLRNNPAAIEWLSRLRMVHLQEINDAETFRQHAQELHEHLTALQRS